MHNTKIRNIRKELLSDNWYTLNKFTFEYLKEDGIWETQQREIYDCGDGAAILLYNKEKKCVVLTRQFRIPTYVNDNKDGMMIEVCAGLLDGLDPESCIKKEALEETGYQINKVKQVFVNYMCPGAVTQKLYLFIGEYNDKMKIGEGGGADDETENIEVMEIPFQKALEMVNNGEICDSKSIQLLQYAQINNLVS